MDNLNHQLRLDSLLQEASSVGNSNSVRNLISLGANKEVVDRLGLTPLHLAARAGHVDAVNELLRARAGTEVHSNRLGQGHNSVDVFNSGFTPLHFAAMQGRVDIVNALVGANANKEALGYMDETPLHLAAKAGHVGVVNALVGAGANTEAQNIKNETPLHLAAMNKTSVGALTSLINFGANKEAVDNRGNTPLDIAKIHDNKIGFKELIASGAVKHRIYNNRYYDWYTRELGDKKNSLFGKSIEKAIEEKDKGRPELLAKMLGGTIGEDKSILPAETIKKVRDLFEPYGLENGMIPDLKKQIPGLKIESNAEIAAREQDFLNRAKSRSQVSSDMRIDDK